MSRIRKLRVGLCAVSLAGIAAAVMSVSTASVASADYVVCTGSITINTPIGISDTVACNVAIPGVP